MHYKVPILGYVAVWFTDFVQIVEGAELKKKWLLPVSTVLKIAKASVNRESIRQKRLCRKLQLVLPFSSSVEEALELTKHLS